MQTKEVNTWLSAKKCHALVEALNRRHFTGVYCETVSEAADYIVEQAKDANSIGFGGSYTIKDLGVEERLARAGKTILNHGHPGLSPEQHVSMMNAQLTCDLFLSGSNAVTSDGRLVNIDGNGNRVAAMIYGPKKVIVVVGRNKIVDGGVDAAIRRVKQISAPANAMRLERQTPCAVTGFCCDCDSPQRICCVTTVIECKPHKTDLHVVVVNEDMGL